MNALFKTVREAWKLAVKRPNLSLADTDYDRYWQDKRPGGMGKISRFQRNRAQIILQYLKDGDTVLDIGSGDGAILRHLAQHRRLKITATDFSEYALRALAGQGMETLRLDAREPIDRQALPASDHVTILEVLEHMQNPEGFLMHMVRHSRRSVIFSVPNTGYFPYRLRLALGSFPVQWRLHPGEHLRFWTLRDLRWWVRQLGLADRASIRCYEGIPMLNRLWPAMFAMGMVCIVTTQSDDISCPP